jgi:hypothetical protein
MARIGSMLKPYARTGCTQREGESIVSVEDGEGTPFGPCKILLGAGRAVPVKSYTGVQVDHGHAEQQHVSGVRGDGGVVVTMTEERDW